MAKSIPKVLSLFLSALIFCGTLAIFTTVNTTKVEAAAIPGVPTSPYAITANGVNLRSGPGTGYKSYGHLQKGDTVHAYPQGGGGWVFVYSPRHNLNGFVSTAYISILMKRK